MRVIIIAIALIYGLTRRSASQPSQYKLFPVWATLEIALTSYFLANHGIGRSILSKLRRNDGYLFGLTSEHQLLVNFPDIDRFMAHSSRILDAAPVQYTLLTRVFGATDSSDLKKKLEASWEDLRVPIERLFLNESKSSAALDRACISLHVQSFVTFARKHHDLKLWELAADIQLKHPTNNGDTPQVEANLQSLVRDFGAAISIPQLYGKDFLRRYPEVLHDFWKFDNDLFPLCMVGIPLWAPFKAVRQGLAARTRIINELEGLYRRIDQYQKKSPIDFDADMSDVSEAALERNMVYGRDNWSFRERGAGDLGILWGQNANTQPVIFWLLTYIYSKPNILGKVREEIAPYVNLTPTVDGDVESWDPAGLCKHCQVLKACIFETYRLVNEPTSIRYVTRPVAIKDDNMTHELKPDTFVSAPHSLINHDASVYSNPDEFEPWRFLEPDPLSGTLTARYGRLRPWGSGAAMCKGRTFAEKEIAIVGAAILSSWHIKPAGGTWKLPAMIPGTGVRKPVRDIRVVISKRV